MSNELLLLPVSLDDSCENESESELYTAEGDELENTLIAASPLPETVSADPFDYYFHYPYLTLQQEQDLSKTFKETGCLKAAHQLVLAHMRYVVKLARNYVSYGLPLHDLVQEGAVGLMKAVQRFDPYQGVRLVSFAMHWIKSEMHEYIIRNWRLVKIATTKAQRKLFFNFRRLMAQKQQEKHQSEVENTAVLNQWHQEIAHELDVSLEDVQHMAQRFNDQEMALDQPVHGQEEGASLANVIPAQALGPAEEVAYQKDLDSTQKQLEGALTHLSERDQAIIKERFYQDKKTTFKELAERYGVSVERIRQIEKTALGRLRQFIDIEPAGAF